MNDLLDYLPIIGIIILVSMALVFVSFSLYSYFSPKRAEVQRETFEQSKSYVHGKIQDLSKWYLECKEDPEKLPVIKNMVQAQFSDFDAGKIDSVAIRQFLIEMRGY